MNNFWYDYNDDDSELHELYEELEEYLDDSAIYEPNDDMLFFNYQSTNAYVTANAVALVLAVACMIGIWCGPRGLAFDVFVLKAITLVLNTSFLIGVPYIKRWSLRSTVLPIGIQSDSGAIYGMIVLSVSLSTLTTFNDCLSLIFCLELYFCIYRLEVRENDPAAIWKKAAVALAINILFYGITSATVALISGITDSKAAIARMSMSGNFRVFSMICFVILVTFLAVRIVRTLIKNMAFRNAHGHGAPTKSRPIYLIVLVITIAFCVYLKPVIYIKDIVLIWYHVDFGHMKECKTKTSKMPFECFVVNHDLEVYEATVANFLQFPVLFLHVGKSFLQMLQKINHNAN